MFDVAHGVEPKHPIFHEPLKVDLKFEEVETPVDYFIHPGAKAPGEPMQVWRVQNKSFPEVDPGLVSTRSRFMNSPDTEVISGGLNSKGPTSVAIGRHGNFFLWGFSARPSDMTPDGQKCFVNSICYIKRFEGQTPTPVSHQPESSRAMVLRAAYYMRTLSDRYIDELVRKFEQDKADYPEQILTQIGDDPAAYYRKIFASSVQSQMRQFPSELREQFGQDAEKYIQYYEENLEYLRPAAQGVMVVDEDVKSLGMSNRDIALLDRCVKMMERDDRAALAERILKRYTQKDFSEATQWRKWLSDNRSRLSFSESAGFRFVTSPANQAVSTESLREFDAKR